MQTENDGRHDFDFFVGNWNVHHRRLREILKGSTDWDEFQSTVVDRTIMGGMGNLEEMTFQRETGPSYGTSLSIFNPKTQQWSQYWVDSVNAVLQDPMVGRFQNGVGEFFSAEEYEGKTIACRAIWSHITETSCQWEQALSEDVGKTWETNWIMKFERI